MKRKERAFFSRHIWENNLDVCTHQVKLTQAAGKANKLHEAAERSFRTNEYYYGPIYQPLSFDLSPIPQTSVKIVNSHDDAINAFILRVALNRFFPLFSFSFATESNLPIDTPLSSQTQSLGFRSRLDLSLLFSSEESLIRCGCFCTRRSRRSSTNLDWCPSGWLDTSVPHSLSVSLTLSLSQLRQSQFGEERKKGDLGRQKAIG